MLGKLAVLFLVGMVIMALFLARPRGGERDRARGKPPPRRGPRRRVTDAFKCPACGSWRFGRGPCACGHGA